MEQRFFDEMICWLVPTEETFEWRKLPEKSRLRNRPAPPAIKPVKQTLTKSALINLLAEENEIPRKTAVGVYTTLENLFLGSVHPRGVGEFVLPGTSEGQPAQGSGPQSRHARPQSFNGGDGESRSQAGQRASEDPGAVEAEDCGDSVACKTHT